MTTHYVTQARCVKDGKEVAEWTDICGGHEKFENAQACHAHSEAWYDGQIEPDGLIEAIALRQLDHLKAKNIKYELRMVRRTITEEVVDA